VSDTPDYSAFPSAAPASDSLAHLTQLVEQAREMEERVAAAEEELRTAKEELRRVIEGAIPEAMLACGMETFKTLSGLSVTLRDDLQVNQPPVAQRGAAYAWLEENGQGGLLKRGVEIAFGAGSEEAERAHELARTLGGTFPGSVRENLEVNTASLKAFLARALKAGESPPLELFGARKVRAAKIVQK
jgi:hypothetical protein